MNVVIINHYAGSPGLGMEFRPYYLAREWSKMGHHIMIIGASYSHLRFRQPEVPSSTKKEVIDGIEYVWIKVNTYSGNRIGRIISMVRFTIGLFHHMGKVLSEFKPALIISSSTYPLDNFPAKKFARKFKAKFCYEVHDLWPLSPMELGGYSRYHPFILLIQCAEDFGYKHADFVVSMLPKTKEYMLSRGLEPHKFFYIPNGISIEEWEDVNVSMPLEHTLLINSLKLRFSFLVGYAGGHSISNSLHSLVRSGKFIDSQAAIVLIGDGMEKEELLQLAKNENHQNIFFLPPVPKKCIPGLLKKFDALFIGAPKQSLYRFGISPNKVFDYMMAGKPIIQAIEAGNNMVVEHSCGVSVEPENANAIALGIRELMSMNSLEREAMGENGKKAALEFYDYRILSKKFLEALKR